MTAEQLEELLAILNTTGDGDAKARKAARDMLYDFSTPLARRVLAAEKLAKDIENALAQDDDHWALCSAALDAYREINS